MATGVATPTPRVNRGRLVLLEGSTSIPTGVVVPPDAVLSAEPEGTSLAVVYTSPGGSERLRLVRTAEGRWVVEARSGRVALGAGQAIVWRDAGFVVTDGACSHALAGVESPPALPSGPTQVDARGAERPAPPHGATEVQFAPAGFAPLPTGPLHVYADGAIRAWLRLDDRLFTLPLEAGHATIDIPAATRCTALVTTGSVATRIGYEFGDEATLATRLVSELAVEGARADDAIRSLARLGEAARAALEATFPDATRAERRRILRAAAGLVRTAPNALRLYVLALESGDAELEAFALESVLALGRPGLAALEVATERGHATAAARLAERAPARAGAALVVHLGAEHDLETLRAMRPAVVVAAGRSAEARATLLGLARSTDDPELAAFLVAATAADPGAAEAVRSVCARAGDHVPSALRCFEAASAAGIADEAEVASALRAGTGSAHWMVRAAAYEALARSGRLAAIEPALDDETPRVRATAVAALSTHPPALRRIAELARRDPHALVRLAADRVLLDHAEAEALVRLALGDRSTRVRVGVYEALAARGDTRFVAVAREAVSRGRGSTASLVAAVRYLGSACDPAHVDVLETAVDAGREGTSERARAIALAAATALADLPDARAQAAAARLLGPAPAGRSPRCRR